MTWDDLRWPPPRGWVSCLFLAIVWGGARVAADGCIVFDVDVHIHVCGVAVCVN